MTKRKPIPQGVRFNVLRRDGFKCRYCGRGSPEVILHLDHSKPHSAGGADTEDNLITACEACNIGKGAKIEVSMPVVTPAPDARGLVGLFGHSYSDGPNPKIKYQFHVVRQISEERYAVQLFSWAHGGPTDILVWTVEELERARFYESEEAWNLAAAKA